MMKKISFQYLNEMITILWHWKFFFPEEPSTANVMWAAVICFTINFTLNTARHDIAAEIRWAELCMEPKAKLVLIKTQMEQWFGAIHLGQENKCS